VICKIEKQKSKKEQEKDTESIHVWFSCFFHDGQPPGQVIAEKDSGKKRQDIYPKVAVSDDSRIGVVKNNNKRKTCQTSCCAGSDKTGEIAPCVCVLEDRKEENWEKEEFQMLPGRFIDRGDQSRKIVSAGPFIEKMEKDSGNQGEDAEKNFCVKVLFLKISHSNLRFLTVKNFRLYNQG